MAPRSLLISAALHILLAIFIIFGLPALPRDELLIQPQVITVELDIPIAPVANAQTSRKNPVKKPEEQTVKQPAKPEPVKEKPKKEEPKPEPTPEPKKPEPKKEEKKPEPKPAPAKEKPKKEEPKKEPEKKKEQTLDDILKGLENDAPKTEEKPKDVAAAKGKDITSDVPFDPNMPLAQTVKDSIRNQIMKCWNYQGGAKEQDNLRAHIQVIFHEDGSVLSTNLKKSEEARKNSDPAFRSLVDSATRALRNPNCVPLKGLPRDSYPSWSKVELVFDPDDMW